MKYLTHLHQQLRAALDPDIRHTELSNLPFNVGSKIWLRCQDRARNVWRARSVSLASLVVALTLASVGILLCNAASLPSWIGLSIELLGWFSALIGMRIHRAVVARLARAYIDAEILGSCSVCGSAVSASAPRCPDCQMEQLREAEKAGWACRVHAA